MTDNPLAGVISRTHRSPKDLEPLPAGRVGQWLATLDPGYFALVMATGIVSIGSRLLGHDLIAEILLVLAVVGWVGLFIAYAVRGVRFPRRFLASLTAPSSAVAYFTVVAGTNVLAAALLSHGTWLLSLVMGVFALLVWVVLTYGLFSSVVLAGNRPALREITGVWLVWVVGTQSVAVLSTALSPQVRWPMGRDILGVAGVLFWSVGVVLYLILIVIIFLRLFLIETTPGEMGPAYWILMGATAISVRAAAGILDLSLDQPNPLLSQVHPFVAGFAVMLWSFGTWFIPMLVIFGLWRYLMRHYPRGYESKLWSVVFPLGMYAVASVTLGRAIDVDFMKQLAAWWVWVGITAWAAVVVIMLVAVARYLTRAPAYGGSMAVKPIDLLASAPTSAPTSAEGSSCACGHADEEKIVLDVRQIPHAIRHATIFGALGAIAPGFSIDLVADHNPLPLLAQLDEKQPGAFTVDYLKDGPEVWELHLTRQHS